MLILNKTNTSPTTGLQLQTMIQTVMDTAKCRKCGCMKETLITIQSQLSDAAVNGRSTANTQQAAQILGEVEQAVEHMEPIEYT